MFENNPGLRNVDSKRIEIAKNLAEVLHNSIDPESELKTDEELKKKGIGYA